MEDNKELTAISNDNNAIEEISDPIVDEVTDIIENDPDVIKLKSQEAELMSLIANPKVMKAYRAFRNDIYGVGERKPVSKAEKKKKKAKRRMVKKSKR